MVYGNFQQGIDTLELINGYIYMINYKVSMLVIGNKDEYDFIYVKCG